MQHTSQTTRLTKKQRDLIDALADGKTPSEAIAECNVTPAVFRRWLGGEAFAAEMAVRQDIARRQSKLMLAKSATEAAANLIGLLKAEQPETARKACLDVLALTGTQAKKETAGIPLPQPKPQPLDEATAAKMLDILAEESA